MGPGTACEFGAMEFSNFEFRISNFATVHLTEIPMNQTFNVERSTFNFQLFIPYRTTAL